MRRRCIRPLVVKAIGGLSLTPSDTGVMPQKIHPNSGIGDAKERSNFERFEIASQTRIHLVGLRRSLVSQSDWTGGFRYQDFGGFLNGSFAASYRSGQPTAAKWLASVHDLTNSFWCSFLIHTSIPSTQ